MAGEIQTLAQAQPTQPPVIGGANSTPPTDPVAAARTEIDRRLEGTGTFGEGTQADSRAILAEFRNLSAADASRLTRELAAAGKLDDVARMTTDNTVVFGDGVSASDRQAFFADMAGKLDGPALAQLSRAFGSVGEGSGTPGGRPSNTQGLDYARELGRAVATHALPATRVDFVANLAGNVAAPGLQSDFSAGLFSSASRTGNPQAAAIGEVLASLRGDNAQRAFASLSNTQMQAVFAASTGEVMTVVYGGGGPNTRYDTSGFDRIAQAAASIPDAHVKAQVFAAGTASIRSERIDNVVLARMVGVDPRSAQGAVANMANSLARIIESDPAGVIRDLGEYRSARRGEVATADGSALAVYAKAMIQSGDEGRGRLGAQLGLVAAGTGAANPTAAFNAVVDGEYRTAEALGYFIGAVGSATRAIDSDVAAQRELLTGVLQSGLSVVDKGIGNNPAAAIAKDWLGSVIAASVNGPDADFVSRLVNAAIPSGGTGYDASISGSRSAFETSYAAVMRDARP